MVPLGPPQVSPCGVGSRPVPGGGSRLSLEKARTQRVAGGCPPPPWFMARSLALARFGVGWRSGTVVGLFRCPCTCPDLGRFFCAVFKFYERQPLPVRETTPPSPPSWGAGRYGRGMQGRRPVSEHRKNLPLATNQREVGPGRREPLSALVFFPPAFFQRKPGSPAGVGGGNPRRRAHPAAVPMEPPHPAPVSAFSTAF